MDKTDRSQPARQAGALPMPLKGMIPPMITPLAGDDALDHAGLERLVEHILGGGVHGLFILGSTGEGPSLSYHLRRELITQVCRQVNRRVSVLVGISDASLAESIGLARFAAEAEADAVVCTSPFYFPINDAEHLAYFRALNKQLPLPLYLYNMPALTKVNFSLDVVRALRDEPNILGLKDSSGDLKYFQSVREVAAERPNWALLVGPERLLADAVLFGADGGVCGGANVHPRLLVDLYEAAVARDTDRLAKVQTQMATLGRLYQLQTANGGPPIAALKMALSCLGICEDRLAAPLAGLDRSHRVAVQQILEEVGLRKNS
jgi:4-hydroxy-tetrahydrodipicolinate synthase